MNRARHSLPVLLALALGLSAATAGSTEMAVTTVANVASIQTLDEVVVSGRLRTLSDVKGAMIAAEDRFYDRFNELNRNNDFDIICRQHAPIGTRITHRVCNPQFVENQARLEALQMMGIMNGSVRVASESEIRRGLTKAMQQRIRLSVDTDPQLMLALLQHAKLAKMYKDLRAEKFAGGKLVVWD